MDQRWLNEKFCRQIFFRRYFVSLSIYFRASWLLKLTNIQILAYSIQKDKIRAEIWMSKLLLVNIKDFVILRPTAHTKMFKIPYIFQFFIKKSVFIPVRIYLLVLIINEYIPINIRKDVRWFQMVTNLVLTSVNEKN